MSLAIAVASITVLAIVIHVVTAGQTEDFCNTKLCAKGVTHVACNSQSGFQGACPAGNTSQVPSSQLQELILQLHNTYRSQVATGNMTNYAPAARMLQMKWDDNLAYVAGFNARSCTFGHDKCRSTTAYPWSGQNIAASSSTLRYPDVKAVVTALTKGWFGEYANANQSVMDSFHSLSGPGQIGHFTAMVHQKSGHIGCAVVRYNGPVWFNTYLVCNYEYTNMLGEAVYTSGPPCSQCPAGTSCSKDYAGLCV